METVNTYYENLESLKAFADENRQLLFSYHSSVLVQVFSGIYEESYITKLLGDIRSLLPHAKIIGTTTSGEVMNGAVSELKTVLSFSAFENTNIRTGLITQNDKDSYALGLSAASQWIGNQAKLLILFTAGSAVNDSKLLNAIQSVNPGLPIAGGRAGNNFQNGASFIFCEEGITDCGIAGAVFENEHLTVNQYWNLCWTPIGKEMTITKTDGFRVYTIDDIPAYQIYRKYLGLTDNSYMINSIFPLLSKRHGVEVARVPVSIYDDDSIEYNADMIEGEKVRFSYGYVAMILKSVDKLIRNLEKEPAESIFVYSCALRRGFLQESTEIETLPLQNIAPTSGFFTGGEFFHTDNTNHLLAATMTTLAISESDQISGAIVGTDDQARLNSVQEQPENYENKNVEILLAMTNLVNTVTNELTERTTQLEKANIKIKYDSIHDSLTGLYNKRFFEKEMGRLAKGSKLGIIVCDVDGLKLINDTLGHNAGDVILRATADIIRTLNSPAHIAARIGGDEFSVIMENASPEKLETACNNIRKAAADYNQANPTLPLSISTGFAYSELPNENIKVLFQRADSNMYRDKLKRSKDVRNQMLQILIKRLEEKKLIQYDQSLQKLMSSFAAYLGVPKINQPNLQLFARFHDIGKVSFQNQTVFQAGRTDADETEMRQHCETGYRIAQSSSDFLPIADWILKHHEWWNGNGYPLHMAGDEIPLECRIFSIVHEYVCLIGKESKENVIQKLKRQSGIKFDPLLLEKFTAMMINLP